MRRAWTKAAQLIVGKRKSSYLVIEMVELYGHLGAQIKENEGEIKENLGF